MRTVAAATKVLVVEDDRKLAAALKAGLSAEGYAVSVAASAEEGFFLLHQIEPELLILDVTLPSRNGLELLQQLRKEQLDVRVMLLTSHNSVEDRVEGLRTGADDYVGKPFSFPELLARAEALLRRMHPALPASAFSVADLRLDARARTAVRGDKRLELTNREFDVLLYLAENAGRIVSREMLLRDVWKEHARYTPLDNVIDVQMARLRKKVDDPFAVKLLHTVRGLGFSLKDSLE